MTRPEPFDLEGWLDRHPEIRKSTKHRPHEPDQPVRVLSQSDAARNIRRAASWLSRVPGAVSGQNGHGTTLNVAIVLLRGFLVPFDDAVTLMHEWNQSCIPPWRTNELMHKLQSADNRVLREPDGWMLTEHPKQSPFANLGEFDDSCMQ